MKFVITREELNTMVSRVFSVVPLATKGSKGMAILSNILIEARGDVLTITGTDLSIGIRTRTKCKIFQEGTIAVSGKTFSNFIKTLTAQNLEVTVDENYRMEILADSSVFKINGMSGTEYPSLPLLTDAMPITVKQSDLREVLYRTAFAVSKEDNRYVLTGVRMTIDKGIATFIGTDGKRLSKGRIAIESDTEISGGYSLTLKAVEEAIKILQDKENLKVTMYLLDDKIAFEANNTIIIAKNLSGEYPDVERVIPLNNDAVIALHREELSTLLRQISLFAPEDPHSVRFSFHNGELLLDTNDRDVGEGKVSMPVNYQGPKIDIAFNPNFFLDVLSHSKHENIHLAITDSYSPGLITDVIEKSSEEQGEEALPESLFVLMPMRLSEE